jgi:hypothetical protein
MRFRDDETLNFHLPERPPVTRIRQRNNAELFKPSAGTERS